MRIHPARAAGATLRDHSPHPIRRPMRLAARTRLVVALPYEPGIRPIDSEISPMAKTISRHPHGPVHCESCARTGKHIEMLAQDALEASFQVPEDIQPEGLRSYRCPACENIQVFRVD